MSGMPSVIYAIGDSQIRSISYNKAILPFFIGGSAFNNFLTEKKASKTAAKIRALLAKSNGQENILFMMNGDPIHFSVKTLKVKDEEKSNDQLVQSAERFTQLLKELNEEREGKIAVCSSVIGAIEKSIETFEIYNGTVKQRCEEFGILYIDIYNQIVTAGKFNEKYRADWAHINQAIAPYIVDQLKEKDYLDPKTPSNNYFEFSHLYDVPTSEGSYRIWGDFDPEGLRLGKKSLRYTIKLHKKTLLHQQLMELSNTILESLCSVSDEYRKLLINSCEEGFIPFAIKPDLFNSILAIDEDPDRIKFAKHILPFYARTEIEFLTLKELESSNFSKYKLLMDFDPGFSSRLRSGKSSIQLNENIESVIFYAEKDQKEILNRLKEKGYKKTYKFNTPNLKDNEGKKVQIYLANKGKLPYRFIILHHRWNLLLTARSMKNFLKEMSKKPQKAIDAYKYAKKNKGVNQFKKEH